MKTLLLTAIAYLTSFGGGDISYEPGVGNLVDRHVSYNKSREFVTAYTVQIQTTRSQSVMNDAISKINKYHPGHNPFWEYKNPNYIVRVGAFETKLEAEQLIHKIKGEFPAAYPAKYDKFKPSDLLN